jgi:hypothetical protein
MVLYCGTWHNQKFPCGIICAFPKKNKKSFIMVVHFKWLYSVTCGIVERCDMGYHFNLGKKHIFTCLLK